MTRVLVLLLSLCSAAALAAATAHASPARSTVTIELTADGTGIRGAVRSRKPRCERGREVRLTDGERGGIRRHGTTNRRGRYRLAGVGGPLPPGDYVVRVLHKRGCRPAKSRTLHI